MKASRKSTYTIELDEIETVKLHDALAEAMSALPEVPPSEYSRLVSHGVVDQLLALRTVLGTLLNPDAP